MTGCLIGFGSVEEKFLFGRGGGEFGCGAIVFAADVWVVEGVVDVAQEGVIEIVFLQGLLLGNGLDGLQGTGRAGGLENGYGAIEGEDG